MLCRRILAGVGLLAWAAASAARPGVSFSAPRAGDVLRAGEEVEVRWTEVPAHADEMELLLSLDGGQRISLRLTEELPSSARSFVWKVPNLSTTLAALVLRVGEGDDGETIAAVSEPFAIVPDASLASERIAVRGGELWIGAGVPQEKDGLPAAGLAGEPDGWRNAPAPRDLAGSTVRPTAARREVARSPAASGPPAILHASPRPRRRAASTPVPLRI